MTDRNDGGNAFPVPSDVAWDEQKKAAVAGMSLRDWFAGQAISGILASAKDGVSIKNGVGQNEADCAYAIADAMLAAREK